MLINLNIRNNICELRIGLFFSGFILPFSCTASEFLTFAYKLPSDEKNPLLLLTIWTTPITLKIMIELLLNAKLEKRVKNMNYCYTVPSYSIHPKS